MKQNHWSRWVVLTAALALPFTVLTIPAGVQDAWGVLNWLLGGPWAAPAFLVSLILSAAYMKDKLQERRRERRLRSVDRLGLEEILHEYLKPVSPEDRNARTKARAVFYHKQRLLNTFEDSVPHAVHVKGESYDGGLFHGWLQRRAAYLLLGQIPPEDRKDT